MGTMLGLGGGLVALLVAILLFVLAVLWIILPFAVFGIRKQLDVAREAEERLLHQVLHELKRANYIAMIAHGLREENGADGVVRVLRP